MAQKSIYFLQKQNGNGNSINIAFEVVLQFSFKRKLDGDVSPGRSKRKGDKQVRTRKNTYPGTVKKDMRPAPPRIHIDAGSFIPSNYSSSYSESPCLHSLHCLRSTAKGLPNTPYPEPTSTLPTSLRRPPLRSKMKIGWCSREIRGGRARVGGGRRS